jgi:hypothetical protein
MKNLEEIKKIIEDLAAKIDVPLYLLPVYGNYELGKVDIQIRNGKYDYVCRPRYVNTSVEDELLFAVFADITNHMGLLTAIEMRINREDPRRKAYPYQLRLLEKLNSEWKKRREEEIEDELHLHPYEDSYGE